MSRLDGARLRDVGVGAPAHPRPPEVIRLALTRALQAVPLLFGVATLTFFLTRVLPGDPTYGMLGSLASPELVKSTRHQLGFDRPLWDQFTSYLGDIAHFDFG